MKEAKKPLLVLRGVERSFDTAAGHTRALNRVTLTVRRGEFVAIVGRSGAGKSTLLNILGLLDSPTAGEFMFAGRNVRELSEGERNRIRSHDIGFVFQDSHVLLDESAMNNAALGLQVQGVRFGERRSRVTQLLSSLGLGHRIAQPARLLSGGERQRVAVARAIATTPSLLLADEPTGALDRHNTELLMGYLRRLHSEGMTVVIITHDDAVASMADRRVRIEDGVIEDDVTVEVAPTEKDGGVAAPLAGLIKTQEPSRRVPRIGWKLWDDVMDAVSNHSSRPGRTALLLLAFSLGIGGLVASVGISQSAAIQVADRITQAGLDEVTVRTTLTGRDRLDFYADAGADSAKSRVADLEGVAAVGYSSVLSRSDAAVTHLPPGSVPSQIGFTGQVMVTDSDYLGVQGATVTPASSRNLLESGWNGSNAILGRKAADELNITGAGPGAVIWVNEEPVDVIGILEQGGRLPALEDSVILSRAAAEGIAPVDPQFTVRTLPGYPAPVAAAIPLTASPGEPAAVAVETVADLRSLRRGVQADLVTFVAVIAVVLLALAALSAATSMYLSVQARSAEIALRRAVGASRSAVWRLFTVEGFVIGLAGGITGAAVGMAAVLVANAMLGWTPALSVAVAFLGVGLGAVTGIVSAMYPAVVAARADPATAIRR